MSIDHPDELAALRAAGPRRRRDDPRARPPRPPRRDHRRARRGRRRVFARHGARSGPLLDYDFPGTVCISIDDECVHGIPGPRRLREGQLVKLDVTAELDGFYADACRTVPVGRVKPREQRLAAAAQSALRRGLEAATGRRQRRRDRRRRADRGRAPRVQRLRRAHRPRHRPPHPRGARRPEHRLGRAGADQRARDHRRADHRGRRAATCTSTTTAGRSAPTTARPPRTPSTRSSSPRPRRSCSRSRMIAGRERAGSGSAAWA